MRSSVLVITVTLVCTAMALPSPSTEESEGVRPKRQNPNKWDGHHKIECPTGEGLYKVESRHDNYYEDRIFDYDCRAVGSSSDVYTCEWTDYVNKYDESFSFQCPWNNQFLAGTESQHSNYYEDRRFKFRCCSGKRLRVIHRFTSSFWNKYDEALSYTAPDWAKSFCGISSEHNNYYE